MFGVESKELLIILFAALILFGPRRIPEVARALGKGLGDIRDALSGIERDVRHAADALSEPGARPAAGAGTLPANAPQEAASASDRIPVPETPMEGGPGAGGSGSGTSAPRPDSDPGLAG